MPDKIVNHFVLADGSTAKYDAGALLNLDDTVSLAGYAPDAKAVGDRLSAIEETANHADELATTLNEGGLELKDGVIAVNVEDWLNAHPEATTTVQDDSLTTAKYKNNSVTTPKLADGAVTSAKVDTNFLKTIENAYVTPEQFGAVGDGVTDDTTAIRNAINSGLKVVGTFGYKYRIVEPISISTIFDIESCHFIIDSSPTTKKIFRTAEGKNVFVNGCVFETTADQSIDTSVESGYGTGETSNIICIYASYGSPSFVIKNTSFKNMWMDVQMQGANGRDTKIVCEENVESTNAYSHISAGHSNYNFFNNLTIEQAFGAGDLSHIIYIGANDNENTTNYTYTYLNNSRLTSASAGAVHCYHGVNYKTLITNTVFDGSGTRPFMSAGKNDLMLVNNCDIKTPNSLAYQVEESNHYIFSNCNIIVRKNLMEQSGANGITEFKNCDIVAELIAPYGHVNLDSCNIKLTTSTERIISGAYNIITNSTIEYSSTYENPIVIEAGSKLVHNYFKNNSVSQFCGWSKDANNVVTGNIFDHCPTNFYGYGEKFTTENILINVPS